MNKKSELPKKLPENEKKKSKVNTSILILLANSKLSKSAIAPWRLTMILIMQFFDNLSDPAPIRNLKAVEILRQVWLQQYYAPQEGKVQLRTEKDGLPHAKRIFSPYDTEARKSTKRNY